MHKAVSILLAGSIILAGCVGETGTTPAAPNPGIACSEALARNPDFEPIRGKIVLGNPQRQPAEILDNIDKATDAEKPAITAWLKARQECFRQSQAWNQQQGFPKEYLSLLADINVSAMARTEELLAGRLSYGDYARARRDLSEKAKIDSEKLWRYLQAQ